MEKYDLTYQKDSTPAQAGIALIIAYGLMYYSGFISTDNHITILQITALIRIGCCIWIYNIAKNLNRKPTEWTILCFFAPAIALICISTLKKIRIGYSEDLDMDNSLKAQYENDLKLLEKSFNDKLLSESEYNNALNNIRAKYSDLNSKIIKENNEVEEKKNREKLIIQLEELKTKQLISEEDYLKKLTELNQVVDLG